LGQSVYLVHLELRYHLRHKWDFNI
jgi:hypothetical protein